MAAKQLKEDYAEIIAEKFGMKYADMLHPTSDEAPITSAFLMASMLCRLSRTGAIGKRRFTVAPRDNVSHRPLCQGLHCGR